MNAVTVSETVMETITQIQDEAKIVCAEFDLQSAILDMQKDNLFHQYQFFVRTTMIG